MTILSHIEKEKQQFLENCIQCGLCAEACPILPYTDISKIDPADVQARVFDFVENGVPNQEAYIKAFACMECFKCTTDICPQDLNPMLVNELIKGDYISKGLADKAYGDAMQTDSVHRVLASVQVSASDYRRITEPSIKKRTRYVFFPGCNVYFQPEKILLALDIMDAIGDERLVAICHYCGQSFAAEEQRFGFSVINYIQLVAEAMGIEREDKFKRYTLWGNLDRIVKDADAYILESPFDKARIVEVVQAVFTPRLVRRSNRREVVNESFIR